MALAARLVQGAQEAVVVEGDCGPSNHAERTGNPAQKAHDERRVAQDERRVERRYDVESHFVPSVCPSSGATTKINQPAYTNFVLRTQLGT